MARKTSTQTDNKTAENLEEKAGSDAVVETPEATPPVNLEVEVSEEPVAAPEAPTPEKLQTDFREKLARKTDNQDVFVPSNPASLEKAAKLVAEENGFDLNRGTSVGARLIARSQNRV